MLTSAICWMLRILIPAQRLPRIGPATLPMTNEAAQK